MKKKLLIILAIPMLSFTQVGINTNSPDTTLDIRATNHNGAVTATDGVLVPRVNSLTANGESDGQLVYLIADDTTNNFTKGFHYWNTTTSNWTPIVQNVAVRNWTTKEAVVYKATTTDPSPGSTTVYSNYIRARKISTKSYEIEMNYSKDDGGSRGSGHYLFDLPASLSFSTSTLKYNSLSASTELSRNAMLLGSGLYGDTGRFRLVGVVPYSSTTFRLLISTNGEAAFWGDSFATGYTLDHSIKLKFNIDVD